MFKNITEYIAGWEVFKANAYAATAIEAARGIYTVGYGFTSINDKPVTKGQTITEDQAQVLLAQEINDYRKKLSKIIGLWSKMPGNQQDALVSISFNMGLFGNPTLFKQVNNDNFDLAYDQFFNGIYQKDAKGNSLPVEGLFYRRACDAQIFKSGIYEKRNYITDTELSMFMLLNGHNNLAVEMLTKEVLVK